MLKKGTLIFLAAAIIISSFTQFAVYSRTASAADTITQTTSPYTGTIYTHSSAFDGLNIYNGIDVSKYNTSVDWEKVKADGIDFVFIRAGYRGYGSSGKLYTDTMFESHITGALAAGLKVGVYFFTQAINTTEAQEEAAYCIEQLKNYAVTLPVVLDYEFPDTGNGYSGGRMYDAKLSKDAATKNCQAFCDAVKDAGYTPMIYANKNDLTTLIDGAALGKSYKIWLANYTTKSSYTGNYEFWQYTEKGKVDGISGNIDCSYWYTDSQIAENPNAISIASAKFSSVEPSVYTGKAINPLPTLTYDGKKLILNQDYTLTYHNNINVGKATITATGIGDYKDTKSVTFKIKPAKVASFTAKTAAKSITLSWVKNASADGYQIWRKDAYDDTAYQKVKTYKDNTKITWKNTGLANDHEYDYCIRAYTIVGDKKFYSDYTYLTAATLPAGTKAVIAKKAKLYSTPELSGKSLVTVPKSAAVKYLGRTYLADKTTVYHIKYTADGKSYSGYISSTVTLKF